MTSILSAPAYAKVNLFLHILGKRADGYHNIYTLFHKVSLYDTITVAVSAADETTLKCDNPNIPTDSRNLIMQVDNILRESYGLAAHFDIELIKRIPIGAGLGGGSSDCATYLELADRLGGLQLSSDDKLKILAKVGSDAPFFLYGQNALGEGRGEVLTALPDMPALNIILVNPGIHISAKEIYCSGKLELTTEGKLPKIADLNSSTHIADYFYNGMEAAVFELYPEVLALRDGIASSGADAVLMSGSGSTVFGVYKDSAAQMQAYGYLNDMYKGKGYLVIKG